jgi:hypothetical protein
VITNSTNLYSQDDFRSRDEALTFHVGLAVRMSTYNDPSVVPPVPALFPAARRRWEQASEALGPAREAEDYQAIGMRLRECLVSLIGEITNDDLVPKDNDRPKAADFKAWFALFAGYIAAGSSSAKLRSYLKSTSQVWNYVNWCTHAKNAAYFDAEICSMPRSVLRSQTTSSIGYRTRGSATLRTSTPMRQLRFLLRDRWAMPRLRMVRRAVRTATATYHPS